MKCFGFLFAVLSLSVTLSVLGCGPVHHSDATLAKISPGTAPASVTAAFNRDHPNVMIKKVVKETYKDGTIHYQYTFIDESGVQQTVEYNAAGEAVK